MVDIRLLAASLTALLEEEHGGTAQLLSLLRREQVALIDGEAGEIAALAAEKAVLIACINGVVARRAACVAPTGFSADPAGMEHLFSAHADLARCCYPIWSKVLESWLCARNESRLNDAIAKLYQMRTERALGVLRQAAGLAGTYGSDGRVQNSSSGRTSLRVG